MIAFTFKSKKYVFSPTLMATMITLLCIPLFIHFGIWQYNKAQNKIRIQNTYEYAARNNPLNFPMNLLANDPATIDIWKYKLVKLKGEYDTQYQFLIDNQVEQERAGFHVITPLKISGTNTYVLINRGWIAGKDLHAILPTFSTPTGEQEIIGNIWVPSERYFSLEKVKNNTDHKLQYVWQNIDLKKYKKQVPISIFDVAIKLDRSSLAGGFVRNWQAPADQIFTNIGYAYQWFGFALATLLIYFYSSTSVTKLNNMALKNNE